MDVQTAARFDGRREAGRCQHATGAGLRAGRRSLCHVVYYRMRVEDET